MVVDHQHKRAKHLKEYYLVMENFGYPKSIIFYKQKEKELRKILPVQESDKILVK